MKIVLRVVRAVLFVIPAFLSPCLSAQSFSLMTQRGSVSASAFVSGPPGADSISKETPVPDTTPFDIFADAAAVQPDMFASAIARLGVTFAPTAMTIAGTMDSSGSVSDPIDQSAGGTGVVSFRTVFTVDTATDFTLTGESHFSWSGGGSAETNLVLRAAGGTIADLSGMDGMFAYRGLLLPGVEYTLTAFGVANSMTSQPDSFASAQSAFNITMTAAPIPEPSGLAMIVGIGCLGIGFLARRCR